MSYSMVSNQENFAAHFEEASPEKLDKCFEKRDDCFYNKLAACHNSPIHFMAETSGKQLQQML